MAPGVKPFDNVRILSDRFSELGAPPGTVGVVVEEYPDGAVEVEIVREDASTVALFSAQQNELEFVDSSSLGPPPKFSAADLQVMDGLRKSGMDIQGVKRIEHFMNFPTQAAAERAVHELLLRKYWVRVEPRWEGTNWPVVASHSTVLHEQLVAGTVAAMRSLAASCGGTFDRWQVHEHS